MDARAFDKSKLASRHVTEGPLARVAPFLRRRQGSQRGGEPPPLARSGVVLERGRALHHGADAASAVGHKRGVDAAGGAQREGRGITITDGIAMGHQGMKSKYADEVGPARTDTGTHAGGRAEVVGYADI
jgi:dihydroxy-acid dehydratase